MREMYSHLWAVVVVNHGDTFTTNVWRDTQGGAERTVRVMYPNAEVIVAERVD
jgi:hypothetical protein